MRFANVLCPNTRCQTKFSIVSFFNRFGKILEGQGAHHWAKNFFASDAHFTSDIAKNSRFDKVPLGKMPGRRFATCDCVSLPLFAETDIFQNTLLLRLRNE